MNALRWLDAHFERIVGGISLGLVVLLVFIGVVARVLFNAGMPWQEELSRVLFVFSLYLGASYGVKHDEHIRVTVLRDLLPPRYRRFLNMLTDIVWMGFNVAVVWYCLVSLKKMGAFPALSAYLGMDTRIPFAVIPALTALQTVRLMQFFYRSYIRGGGGGTVKKGGEGTSCS